MLVEIIRFGGVLGFAVSLLRLRDFFLSAHLGGRNKSNEERCKD